jgi:hypothetical protein
VATGFLWHLRELRSRVARWRCASRPSRALLARADRRHRWTPAPRRAPAAVPSTARPAARTARGMSSGASGRCGEQASSAIGWGGMWRCADAVRCLGGLKGAAGSNPPGRSKHWSERSERSAQRVPERSRERSECDVVRACSDRSRASGGFLRGGRRGVVAGGEQAGAFCVDVESAVAVWRGEQAGAFCVDVESAVAVWRGEQAGAFCVVAEIAVDVQ